MNRIFRADLPLFRAFFIASLVILCAFENNGCSTAKPPTETLARAEIGLRSATEARAEELAPLDMRSARQKLQSAKQAMAASRYEEARRLVESAQVDAELAEARAEAEVTLQAAEELRKSIDALRTEAARSSRSSSSTGAAKE